MRRIVWSWLAAGAFGALAWTAVLSAAGMVAAPNLAAARATATPALPPTLGPAAMPTSSQPRMQSFDVGAPEGRFYCIKLDDDPWTCGWVPLPGATPGARP